MLQAKNFKWCQTQLALCMLATITIISGGVYDDIVIFVFPIPVLSITDRWK